ncbi:MAG TPA: GNAT family protein [Candidatus Angelobacter sp.]|nr:GNAT family protein [Candidatus Angelobacter sp.]
MTLLAREMQLSEVEIVINYFHCSSPEHLELLGVDPTRLPRRADWLERINREYALPIEQRTNLLVTWFLDGRPVGFSSCDKIVFGERANMHLHVVEPNDRQQGFGTECVKQSVDLYFDRLRLKSLFCEPNAFNLGPNRTLQKAGFKYVKTHMTVPGPLNYHQAVTRWVIERTNVR